MSNLHKSGILLILRMKSTCIAWSAGQLGRWRLGRSLEDIDESMKSVEPLYFKGHVEMSRSIFCEIVSD